jgi:YVTN family beta-propeller protein
MFRTRSGTISIIDTANDTVVGDINVGGKPRGIAVAAGRLSASDGPAGLLKINDVTTQTVIAERG